MCGSGAKISGTKPTTGGPRTVRPGCRVVMQVVGCFAVAPGPTVPGPCARPCVAGTTPRAALATSVFEWPGHLPFESWSRLGQPRLAQAVEVEVVHPLVAEARQARAGERGVRLVLQ